MKGKFQIAIAAIVAVFIYLLFTPSALFSKHFETSYDATRFYCGATDIEVTTAVGGASIIVNYNEHKENDAVDAKSVELFYFGSAMFSDHYRAKTGEKAEYDGELKLDDFGGGVGGTCL